MVLLEKITNTYAERQRLHKTFEKECGSLIDILKSKYKGLKSIDIASVLLTHPQEQDMIYMQVAILNTDNRRCILLQVQCDAKLFFWQYDVKAPFKSAEVYLRSRYRGHESPIADKKEITLKGLLAKDIPFMAQLGLSKFDLAA